MFNSKKIKELEKRLNSQLERIWQLENPCPYKVGQKIKQGIVIKVSFTKAFYSWINYMPNHYIVEYFDNKSNTVKSFTC